MAKQEKNLSNPASSGLLGAFFETRVQAAFAVLMLTGRIAPCLPPWPIQKIKLQGHYAGFNTDDFIVFVKDIQSDKEAKLLAQIKHSISITEGDDNFKKVIQAAWNDFNNPKIFTLETDAFALITGPLNATDTNNVRTILEWARHSEDEKEFLFKVNKDNFSSKIKKKKLNAFRMQLRNANDGIAISEHQLWDFLRHFHLIGYDLDTEGSHRSLIQSLIAQSSDDDASSIWGKLVGEVQSFNPDAGTLSLETISKEISNSFNPKKNPHFAQDIKKLNEHGKIILDGIRSRIGEFHIERKELFAKLIESSEENEFVFVVGERGCGKSSLVREYAEYLDEKTPVFCLRTEDLDKPHLDNVFSAIGLTSSLGDLAAGIALMPKKYLLIESLEKLLELQNKTAFTDLIQFIQKYPGWTIIASGRDYAYQQISFSHLQPFGVQYTTLMIDGFSEDDIQDLCENLPLFRPLANNRAIKQLLKNPFYADLAYRAALSGKKFSSSDGEREFRIAVWNDVISKDSERLDGMPLRRRRTFIAVAVKRAKQMVYEVSDSEFDPGAILKLESDNLIHRDSINSRVRPDHDVLEDWALVQYIEDKYQSSSGEINAFLTAIGHEPAMNRAFRLWLNQELLDGTDLKHLILSILHDREIEKFWQDETITAILQGDTPSEFLGELKDQLFENESELLKRFSFILRISCKTPDLDLVKRISGKQEKNDGPLHPLLLKPYGEGWNSVIHLLFDERTHISKKLIPHIAAVLEDWSTSIRIDAELPPIARESGLLALYLLDTIKDSYRDGESTKKLLAVIFRVIPTIQKEFSKMLDDDLFNANTERRHQRYLDDFVEMSLTGIETIFLCKYAPDTAIKIARHEWLINEIKDDQNGRGLYHKDVNECFGLHRYKRGIDFFPASGAKGPFQYLLRYHPKEGLDFIIDLLNITAERYAHSDLDNPENYSSLPANMVPSGVKQVEIKLNDGTTIKQYCSERLWLGYRGTSYVPYVLQSALMALENVLISFGKIQKFDDILQGIFENILRKSNSVMPTAVLASVATGFHKNLGKAALPLLKVPEFYNLDLKRMVHERGMNQQDAAEMQPWRKEDLEALVVRLQFSDIKENIFAILDDLRSRAPKDENWRFRFHRIDSRNWQPEFDKENNRIVFTSKNLEPELEEIQNKTQEDQTLNNRFFSLYLWSDKILKQEPLDREYYPTWRDAFEEIKNLSALIHSKINGDTSEVLSSGIIMFSGGLPKASAALLRDHYPEIKSDEFSLGFDLIAQAVITNADSWNPAITADKTDISGAAASASVLPICLDFASSNEDKEIIKTIIAIALTHVNENVRTEAANGIRNHLWQRDPDFAWKCIIGTVEIARLEKIEQKNFKETDNPLAWLVDFRKRFASGEITTKIDTVNFRTHSPEYLLMPCLMIPSGSVEPNHNLFLLQMLALFAGAEYDSNSDENDENENEIKIDFELPIKFGRLLADHLFEMSDIDGKRQFVEQLQSGCNTSPNLVKWILLYTKIVADKTEKKDRYWKLWSQISENVQKIAIELTSKSQPSKYKNNQEKQQCQLIRNMLFADMQPQYVDHERDNISYGKDLIDNFVANAGKNEDVFEAMSSLMFHFPEIFFESGLRILSKHQKELGGTQISSDNATFYLERCINRFLYGGTSPILKEQYQSGLVLLDSLVETGSSSAYYLREYLIRSRRIIN